MIVEWFRRHFFIVPNRDAEARGLRNIELANRKLENVVNSIQKEPDHVRNLRGEINSLADDLLSDIKKEYKK